MDTRPALEAILFVADAPIPESELAQVLEIPVADVKGELVAWADEHRGMRRSISTPLVGLLAWLLGMTTVFSFNWWSDFHPLGRFETFAGKTLFDIQDYLTSNIMLPLGGILIAVFVGWVLSSEATREELGPESGRWFAAWRFVARYLCPVAIGAVLVVSVT